MSKTRTITWILLLQILESVALNIPPVQEFSSWFPKPEASFDMNSVSDTTFYIPLISKLSLYQMSRYLVTPNEFPAMNDNFAAQRNCLLLQLNENRTKASVQGYGSRKTEFLLHVSELVPSRWDFYFKRPNPQVLKTSYVVLSNKENGLLLVDQWMDGTKSFSLLVPVGKSPSPEFINQADQMLRNKLGFSPENYIRSNYGDCKMTFIEDDLESKEFYD